MRLVKIAAWFGVVTALACSNGSAELAGAGGVAGGGASGGAGASPTGGSGGAGGAPAGHGVGEACSDAEPCRAGLRCEDAVCEPAAEAPLGSPCFIAGECELPLQCIAGVCAEGGAGEAGAPCDTDASCGRGLRCGVVGFGLQCIPQGNVDVGGACAGSAECLAGLTCLEGRCFTAPPGAPSFGLPSAPELECEPPSTGPVRAYFEVPGASPPGLEGDFFRLPFPNDVRLTAGRPNLEGFPTPGVGLLPFDPVALYVRQVEEEEGWGMNPVVTFRFSGPVDLESFRETPDLGVRPVRWVDITAGDPAYGSQAGLRWYYSGGGGKYICRDWFAIRRTARAPLTPGHTYAVFLTTHGRAETGNAIQRSEHLVSVLAATPPPDPKLAAAHAAYAPFRAYLTEQGIPTDQVLNASVITVGDTRGPMERLAAAALAEPVPTASGWVRCGAGVTSPCPDSAAGRSCDEVSASYDEYQALVELPIFQQGDAPYATTGGAIQTSGPVRTEPVCLALTVPKRALPAAGFPLVVFAHGTGGSFRSHVRPEVAGALATHGDGVAVLGFDQVAHGPRRGGSTESSENLFFNFANPAAARGNVLQGAADQLTIARFAAQLDLSAAESGGEALRIDPDAIVFFGHSQGATHGSLALPYSASYRAGVLSGNGGMLRDSLLAKRQPVNIAAALPFILGDLDARLELPGGTHHPVMNLIQHFIEPADPINFAPLVRTPPPGAPPKHLLVTYGLGDSFSPNVTLANYIQAAQVDLAAAHSSVITPDDLGLTSEPVPLSHTDVIGGVELTLAARQYQPPAGRDGHFVVFDVAGATDDVVRFLGMAAARQVPVVGP